MEAPDKVRFIPRRFQGQNLAGLGDLLDDYTNAVMQFSDAYSWLIRARPDVQKTGSAKLLQKYSDLLQKGEGWRQMVTAYQVDPSIIGWLSNIFGTLTNWGTVTIGGKILSTTELGGIVHGLEQVTGEIKQLKLSVDQYNRLVASGTPPQEAARLIDEAQTGWLERIGGAIKWPAIGLSTILAIGALVIFAPEIKAFLKGMRNGKR